MIDHRSSARLLVEHMLGQTGWTASELARRAGLAPSTLTRFLNSPVKHSLSARTLARLSAASGMAVPLVGAELPTVPVLGSIAPDGAKLWPTAEEHVESTISGAGPLAALRIAGDGFFPVHRNGDLLFYSCGGNGIDPRALAQESLVRLEDGTMHLRTLTRGSRTGRWTLSWHGGPPDYDRILDWAAPVLFIDRRARFGAGRATTPLRTRPAAGEQPGHRL